MPALSELTNFHYKKKKETSTSSENDDRGTEGSDNDIYCYETSTESTSSDPGEKGLKINVTLYICSRNHNYNVYLHVLCKKLE